MSRSITRPSSGQVCGLRSPVRFGGDRSGASALEFALVAVPLLLLLFGIFQVALIYLGNLAIEGAAAQGARLIRTGQAQMQGLNANTFKEKVCEQLPAFLTCAKLQVDVRRFNNFGSTQLTNPLDDSGNMKSSFSYDPGNAGDVVVVRVFYAWDVTAEFPSLLNMSNMSGNQRLLMATVAFRNEPYENTSSN
ncbi:MAG TPA: TadE/TadG family type IV pilus assembly protein [Methyloceanibacter sp.]|nr:TadE/TadG family type IV pilus assembly protein [Methyloceanibacter sp.]